MSKSSGWCIEGPAGIGLILGTTRKSPGECIDAFMRRISCSGISSCATWELVKAQGYRCVPVNVDSKVSKSRESIDKESRDFGKYEGCNA